MLSSSIVHKKYNFEGYNIEVLDNVFTLDSRANFYKTIRDSKFQIGWEDTTEIEYQNYKYLHSVYNSQDLNKLGLADKLLDTEFGKQLFTQYNIEQCIVNLSKPGDFYLNHTHGSLKVLLYYVNIRWKEEWSGETLFYNDSMQDILFASPYVPGRLILFDGNTPHTIRSQSSIAPYYRFTFTMFLSKK